MTFGRAFDGRPCCCCCRPCCCSCCSPCCCGGIISLQMVSMLLPALLLRMCWLWEKKNEMSSGY
uniref:Candidate secreted effector n=1 Tax=Meloidogyne incognita TaxID=6306 RepID=A0A914N177_MELIC